MNLCPPAFIYLIFSLIQIFIDSFHGLINEAILKLGIMIVVTFLLNMLCGAGLSFISWIIVLLPFIFMAVSVGILLFVFGANLVKGESPTPVPASVYNSSSAPACYTQKTQNWEVLRGNIVLLPSYSSETIC